jgi:hypothetical protein
MRSDSVGRRTAIPAVVTWSRRIGTLARRPSFAYEALGEFAVAGRAQPVAIHELLAAQPAEEVAAPFVGREREMDRLLAVLDDARAASGAELTTVLRSPGVGKTPAGARALCACGRTGRCAQRRAPL